MKYILFYFPQMLETCFIFVNNKVKLIRTSASLRILVNYDTNTDAIFAVMLMISLCIFLYILGEGIRFVKDTFILFVYKLKKNIKIKFYLLQLIGCIAIKQQKCTD